MEKLNEGVRIHVVGREQEETRVPDSSQTLPPQIVQVSAIVAGDFNPPRLVRDLKKRKLKWLSGSLRKGKGQNSFRLDATNMQVGRTRLVTQVVSGKRTDLKKKNWVRVYGKIRQVDKEKEMQLDRVVILTTKIPKKEYLIVLGPS